MCFYFNGLEFEQLFLDEKSLNLNIQQKWLCLDEGEFDISQFGHNATFFIQNAGWLNIFVVFWNMRTDRWKNRDENALKI